MQARYAMAQWNPLSPLSLSLTLPLILHCGFAGLSDATAAAFGSYPKGRFGR